ncbi:unnamed protein product, partial [Mesorhabditis belari]|uniref:Uncharacterized protein n=1 Tax=Mesorhabditis belari TaxID=2138241 RepID=A0AAF3EJC4_9BILA
MSESKKFSDLRKMFESDNCFTEESAEKPAVPRHRLLNSTVSNVQPQQSEDFTPQPEHFAWESIDQLTGRVKKSSHYVQNRSSFSRPATQKIDYSKEAKLLPIAPKPKIEQKPKLLMNQLSDAPKVILDLNLRKYNQKFSGEILESVNICQEQEEPEEDIPLPIRTASRPSRSVIFKSFPEIFSGRSSKDFSSQSREDLKATIELMPSPPSPKPDQADHSMGQLPPEQDSNWINPSNQINDKIAELDNEIKDFADYLEQQVEKSCTVDAMTKRVEQLTEKLGAKIFLLPVLPKEKFEANNVVIKKIDNLLISYKGVNRRDLYLLKDVMITLEKELKRKSFIKVAMLTFDFSKFERDLDQIFKKLWLLSSPNFFDAALEFSQNYLESMKSDTDKGEEKELEEIYVTKWMNFLITNQSVQEHTASLIFRRATENLKWKNKEKEQIVFEEALNRRDRLFGAPAKKWNEKLKLRDLRSE